MSSSLARSIVPLALISLAAAPSALAQTSGERAGRFVIGGGADLLTAEGGVSTPGAAFLAGYERRFGERFAVRAEWSHWQRGVRFDGMADGRPVPSVARIRTIYGGSALGIYHFAPSARFRTYALAGVGYHQLSLRNETDWVPGASGTGASKIVYASPVRRNSLSYTTGFGVDVPLGRASLFVEARATLFPAGASPRNGGPVQGLTTPVTIGFRF